MVACKKEKTANSNIPTQDFSILKKWDATATTVAKDVAQKLNNIHFRKMLKHEVCLRFDGDANILISSLVKRLPVYLAYEKNIQLATRAEDLEPLLATFNFDILQEAAASFPQMQIAVQTDAESWDAATFIPKVVYETAGYDESTHTSISGFDANQNPISVSTLVDPIDNYVIISQNERTILRPNDAVRIRANECLVPALFTAAPYDLETSPAPMVHCGTAGVSGGNNDGVGGTVGGVRPPYIQYVGIGHDGVLPTLISRQMGTITTPPPNGTFNRLNPVGVFNGTTVYRKNFRHEKMRFIMCDDLGRIESWFKGAPEIRMHVFMQNVLNPSENLETFKEEFEPNKRKDINGKWWNAEDVDMYLWDYEGTGSRASFAYYEYDPIALPKEAIAEIGGIVVDILALTGSIATGNPTQVAIYGSIRQSVVTGIRKLKMKNGVSEYIGKDDYSIFNDEDNYNHNTGRIKIQTWPDL